jgi:cytochrome P450
VQSTINIMKAQNASIDDMARIETFGISVATINTTPTAIWLVINVLANRPLLSTLRDELQAVSTTLPTDDTTKSGTKKIELDLTNAAETCPILYAAYQEALRIGSIPTCNRSVLEDTTFTDPLTGQSVLMKKDVRVSIPTFLLHNQPKIWGTDVSVFNVDHFKDIKERSKDKEQKLAFVPYGGGVHLCPGRHLAQQEIMAVAALIVQALDFEMGDGGGEVVVPNAAARFGVLQPEKPFVLKVKRREGFEMVEWAIRM